MNKVEFNHKAEIKQELEEAKQAYKELEQEYTELLNRTTNEKDALQNHINQLLPLARAFEVIDTIIRMGQRP